MVSGDYTLFVELEDGLRIEDALNEMKMNITESNAKNNIDTWYVNNILLYTNRIEDTIYCNDRSIMTSTNGWFETPTNVANGKVLTMRNMNGGTNTIRPAYGQRIRDFDGWHEHTDTGRGINNDERAEMVYYNNVWYLNVIGS